MVSSDGQPVINLRGGLVGLGPLRRDYLDLYVQWFNDFEARRTYSQPLVPFTRESREEWYERVSRGEPGTIQFGIYELSTLQPIGWTHLDGIDHFQQTAEYGIFIGDKAAWGKGYGTETTRVMLEYGFSLLHLHSIMLKVDSDNEPAIRAYHRAGFREFGRQREVRWRERERCDVVYMECLAREFLAQP
jgi:RimJ/RimL family protein N-acetyltransferase